MSNADPVLRIGPRERTHAMNPIRSGLAVIPLVLLSATAALANPDTDARASFPLVEGQGAARDSALHRLEPEARASFAVEQPPPGFARPQAPPPEGPRPVFSQPPSWHNAPGYKPPVVDSPPKKNVSDDWMFSIEGVTHAPIDAGLQVGLELPMGLRFFGGYGVMPSMYREIITVTAASAVDGGTRALVENAFDDGNAWRVAVGIRPFKSLGFYLDAGYSRVTLSGSATASELTGLSGVSAGAYDAQTQIDMWLVELGYQALIADRVVLGIAGGAMGAFGSKTTIESEGSDAPVFEEQAAQADSALESYAVPTLTLRLGFDLI
jgi:hypothetical protein